MILLNTFTPNLYVQYFRDLRDLIASGSPATADQITDVMGVLRYLPTNLSRSEIAAELCVSLNTVNTHLPSIYAKLQVRDRSSAVQRARELRLLAARRTR